MARPAGCEPRWHRHTFAEKERPCVWVWIAGVFAPGDAAKLFTALAQLLSLRGGSEIRRDRGLLRIGVLVEPFDVAALRMSLHMLMPRGEITEVYVRGRKSPDAS